MKEQKRLRLSVKQQLEFRKLLAVYLEKLGESPGEQHVAIAGMLMLETWVDTQIEKAVTETEKKIVGLNSKLRIT
jgi:hypothetical protein